MKMKFHYIDIKSNLMCGRYTLSNTLNAEFPIPKNMVGEKI